jgi:MoaA/NifB/PqqE/SkfB family radical SAM enzyme
MDKKIVVFGAGETAKKFCAVSKIDVDFFVDNDKEKWNTKFLGKLVRNPDVLLEYKDCVSIFIASEKFNEMISQLSRMGFKEFKDYYVTGKIVQQSELDSILNYVKGPLFVDDGIGSYIKKLMLTSRGKELREKFPQYKPQCSYFPNMIVILSDGSVTTCCMDWQGKNTFGNIYEEDLENIWFNKVPPILEDLYHLEVCRGCIGVHAMSSVVSDTKAYQEWKNVGSCFPAAIQIEIMGACNYKCKSCLSPRVANYRAVKPDLGTIFEKIRPFISKLKNINLFNHGEPLLNEDFCDFIAACRQESEEVVMLLSTNGMLMNEKICQAIVKSRVDQVIVSAHGGPGTENMLKYSNVNADYEKVLENVKRLLAIRKENMSEFPKVSLKAVLFNWNDTDELMDQFRKDALMLGLKPTGGDLNTDNYHWVLDLGKQLASTRFMHGSRELQTLVERGEIQSPEWF